MYRHPMMNGPKFLIETQPAYDDPPVIEAGDCPTRPGVPFTFVRHRDLPELRSESLTHREAAGGLLRHLTAERDYVLDVWDRGMLGRVIAEVQDFLD